VLKKLPFYVLDVLMGPEMNIGQTFMAGNIITRYLHCTHTYSSARNTASSCP